MEPHDKYFKTTNYEQASRPDDYPTIEDYKGLLFYIQRNQNYSTVVYEINLQSGNLINLNEPILIHWLKFDENNYPEKQQLNYIQKKLAYGYHFDVISDDLIEFRFVSYDLIRFFLAKDNSGQFKVFFTESGKNVQLKSIFIYSEDLGVFPQVKWAEFYGKNSSDNSDFYKKLMFNF